MEKNRSFNETRKPQNMHLFVKTHQRYNYLHHTGNHIIAQNANFVLSTSMNSRRKAIYIKVYQLKDTKPIIACQQSLGYTFPKHHV